MGNGTRDKGFIIPNSSFLIPNCFSEVGADEVQSSDHRNNRADFV